MSSVRSELLQKWEEAAASQPGGTEWRAIALSVRQPLRVLAAIREPDERPALLLEAPLSDAPHRRLRWHSDGITLMDQRRPNETTIRLAITLERNALREVFEVLAADLVEVAARAHQPSGAIAAVIRRLEAWQACLKAHRSGLSSEEQLGLLGELVVLRLIAEECGYAAAVSAWLGPLDGLHDFDRQGTAVEVKSAVGVGSLLPISALDQLDTTGLAALLVARPRFREDPEGLSLSGMVLEVIAEIEDHAPAVLMSFKDRLLRAGIILSTEGPPDGLKVKLEELYGYSISPDFPRLTRSNVETAITEASYLIDERALEAFLIDERALRRAAKAMAEDSNG
ncbi:PD-(D/E)XK motif protein [Afifella sp. H1R]|uniref:PD-(D/E)XK motif protein n=1 Tax=Afifella sp. H1R TaxID=2908841 RepID=UPI001F4501A8|nr:PD-(D/E)XK motif protein [Afifella sp. H1R]MCF1504004.1 PD-(D/E)XK motif protein [Afifella sp. H1R]